MVLAIEEEEDELSKVVARDKWESRPIGSQRCIAEAPRRSLRKRM